MGISEGSPPWRAGDAPRAALRVLTCGSVDDGKSTLIGRLLFDRNLIRHDQLEELSQASKRAGMGDGDIDYALLLDGLEAEREQAITIDVAYRYFSTGKRSFIVADTPGHPQYTRNMVTGASHADLAILLVNASKGLQVQTRRHAIIADLLGIRHAVLAVNKMDLVGFEQPVFDRIVQEFLEFSASLNLVHVLPIPLSARFGDNVASKSTRAPWYLGPSLLEHLETVDTSRDDAAGPLRLPVQLINRASSGARWICGTMSGGRLHHGDEVVVLPSGTTSTVQAISVGGEDVEAAEATDAVAITLADHVDVTRGDMLCHPSARPQVADQFSAHVIWMSREPLYPGRPYLMKINHTTVVATITELKHQIDVNTLSKLAAKTLVMNEIAVCNLSVARPIPFDPYSDNRDTGSFILIDRFTNETAAAGMIDFALRRATNVHVHRETVGKAKRSALKQHRPAVLWFTGLPASGKSTIANLVESALNARGVHTVLLDGDNLRHGLNRDLGFTEADRVENMRRTGEVARLMTDAGLIVLCALISPFRAERRMVRELFQDDEFFELFVDTPLEECIARDPKGLYRRAQSGEIKNLTGIGQPYEAPENPELRLRTSGQTPEKLARDVVDELSRRGIIVP